MHTEDKIRYVKSNKREEGRNLDYGHVKSDANEGKMFKSTLRNLIEKAQELESYIENGDDLPQWCHYKVSRAEENISTLRDYLVDKIKEDTCEEDCDDVKNIIHTWRNFTGIRP